MRSRVSQLAVCGVMVLVSLVAIGRMIGFGRASVPPPSVALPTAPLSLESNVRGNDSAPIGMIIFSDFQCPFCARFATEVFPGLVEDYVSRGQLLVEFRHLPLTGIHPLAFRAAAVAECAGAQGRFWQMHDRLFAAQRTLSAEFLDRAAGDGDVDGGAFASCLSQAGTRRVEADVALSKELALRVTPTFIIGAVEGGKRLMPIRAFSGAKSRKYFDDTIAEVLRTVNRQS